MASVNTTSLADQLLETLKDMEVIGVTDELRNLERKIFSARDVLLDEFEKASLTGSLPSWVEGVQHELLVADDLVDELRTGGLRNKELMSGDRVVTKVCNPFPITLDHLDFGKKLEKIGKDIGDKISKGGGQSSPNLNPVPLARSEKTLSSVLVSEDNLIGRDSDLEAILELLVGSHSGDQNVSITSVVGGEGMGKTALARVAFDHKQCVNHFEPRIWVDVSGTFDAVRIADSILKFVTRRSVPPSEEGEIGPQLKKELAGRKYLLLLDGVHRIDRDKWLDFERLLMGGAKGSRVLLTTRSQDAARIACMITCHVLRGLTQEDSWKLFKRVAFPGEVPPPKIEEIAREIVKTCSGIPLLIRTMGSLSQKFGSGNLQKWKAFLNHYTELTHTIREDGDDVLQTLKLSYDLLPSHLKDCFAYCSLFPKGHEIDVQTLIKLWAAQGFVKWSEAASLEDQGYEHLMRLIDRNFFETVERDGRGRATQCKLSVAMHDLAAAAAGKECIKLSLNDDHQTILDHVPRHVSFEFPLSSTRQIPTSFRAARIRSILFPCQSSIKQEGSSSGAICDAIVSNMKFLRMLDLHDSGIETVPDHIDELKHLRYLDLSRNGKIKVLPHSVTKLLNLLTLKLSLCFRLKELPRDIKNLGNLRHLEIDGCYNLTHMPRGLGQLTQLETLSQFVLCKDAGSVSRHDIGQLNELSSLNNLRGELQIKNLQHDMNLADAQLDAKQFLQSLVLDWETREDKSGDHKALVASLEQHINLGGLTLSGYMGDRLPIGPLTHKKLVKLVLRRCPKCSYLPALHLFPSLKELVLEDMEKLEFISENVSDSGSISSPASLFFPSLQELRLTGLPLLRSWWQGVECNESHVFPHLSKLFIEDCPRLDSFPLFPTLDEGLVLDSCSLKLFHDTLKLNTEGLRLQTSTTSDEASSSTSANARPSSFSPPLDKLKNLTIVGIEKLDKKKADGIRWENLTSLQYLRLDYLPSLESLPDGMQHITSLRELHIWRCSLTTLPQWIVDLKILKKLSIWICPDLNSLPEKIGSLTSLQTLEIEDCPMLVHRCQKKAGADWDKISHIPDLRIDLSSRK